jgi:hypothetical protein
MESILQFFSNLILFTFGLAVLIFWIIILFVVIDEIIDLVLHRGKEADK